MYAAYEKQSYYKAALAASGSHIDAAPPLRASSSSTTFSSPTIRQHQNVDHMILQHHPYHSYAKEISLQPAFGYRSGRHRMSMGARLVDDDDNVDRVVEDSDSDAELDHAPVLEAKRVQRRIPNNTLPCRETPFYSELVEPKMSLGDEWPRRNQTRGFRRVLPGGYKAPLVCSPAGQSSKMLRAVTVKLVETYNKHNPRFKYDAQRANPKRVLTKPSKPAKNDGYDNEDYDYILKVNDILGEDKDYQYRVIDLMGQGTFGQVVKCERVGTGKLYSVKVIKNKSAYREQSRLEVEILKHLHQKIPAKDRHHVLHLEHTFLHKNHLCLVFELLSYNLYELIKQNHYRGLSLNLVRVFTLQLLDTLILLKDAQVIHCDLKPENILLERPDSPTIKVIDFGSSCLENAPVFTYIQSRFYRSPEVILGLRYTAAIDMWSLGCIVAELFLGIPLFPGSSEYNQLRRIVDMLGTPPQDMLDKCRNTRNFFNRLQQPDGRYTYRIKSREQYGKQRGKTEMPGKQFFPQTELPDIILKYNSDPRAAASMDDKERERDIQTRHALIDFLQGVLQLNPVKRWTPKEARYHPFVTGEPFLEPYQSDKHMKVAIKLEQESTKSKPLAPVQNVGQLETPSPVETLRTLEAAAASAVNARRGAKLESGDDGTSAVYQRARAQSLGVPQAPSQIQKLVQEIQANLMQDVGNHHGNGRKVRPGQVETQPQVAFARQRRHARSFGDLTGLLPPRSPSSIGNKNTATAEQMVDPITTGSLLFGDMSPSETSSLEKHTVYDDTVQAAATLPSSRKVKIAPMLKVRYGSRDSLRMPDEVHTNHGLSMNNSQSSGTSHDHWLMSAAQPSSAPAPRPRGYLAHAGEAAGGLLMMRQEKSTSSHFSLPTPSVSNGRKRVAAAIKRCATGHPNEL